MVDIDDDPVDIDDDNIVESNDKNQSGSINIEPDNNDDPVVTSPIIKLVDFIKSILGSKVKDEDSNLSKVNESSNSKDSSKAESEKIITEAVKETKIDKPIEIKNDKASDLTSPISGSLATVIIRNDFYRDGFRNMIKIAIAETIIIIVLILSFVSYMNATESRDRYFATTADGRIMRLVPLNLPNMNTSALMSWVSQSATEVMTFGFHDYQRRMQQSSRHFTRKGWESFTSALQKSRIIDSVEASKQVVTAQPRSAPVLIEEGVFNGKYRWVVDLPLTVSYKSGTASRTDNLNVRIVVDRVPSLENPNGVGIEQWIAVAAR